jgi:hypothetical protein
MLLFQNIRSIAHDQVPSPEFTYFHYKFNWITSQVTESWKKLFRWSTHFAWKNVYTFKCAMRLEIYLVWTQSVHSHSTYLILTLMLCTINNVVIFSSDILVCTVVSSTIVIYFYVYLNFMFSNRSQRGHTL